MVPLAVVVIFLFVFFETKLSTANINVNSFLTTTESENSTWLSPSGDFAFGFLKLEESDDYLLGIWYNRIPDRTVVWHANGNSSARGGSKVELTANRLVLTNPEGRILWEANPAATISSAEMRDTGNFVLLSSNSIPVWESFRNPTDTILPSQVLNVGDKLFSRLTETNYTKGRFELQFNGDLKLIPIAWPSSFQYGPYFSNRSYNVNSSESGYQLIFNQSGKIYINRRNGEQAQIFTWDPNLSYNDDFYYRATLDFYGVFTQYSYPRNPSYSNQTWRPVQSIPENICTSLLNDLGSGTCGFNSYCKIDQSRPSCECPPGHNFVDPRNRFGGCKPNVSQDCGPGDELQNPEILYDFETVEDVNFPSNDYERLQPYNETQCKDSCLRDCNCAVLVFGGDICWKKRWPISNGRYELQTSQAGYYTRTMFKIRRPVPPSGFSDPNGNKDKVIILLGVLFGGSAFINVLVLILYSQNLLCTLRSRLEKDLQDSNTRETNQQFFTYRELEVVTDGFKEELGRGSFGIVYKGALKFGSKNAVAVKKLNKLAQDGEREFRTEVTAIGRTHHKNLVQLVGYCDEGSQRLLIYEFMSNGSLAEFLFVLPRPDWEKRVKIALGAARGLLYLHEECDVPIIHCDVKPQNILLDDSLTPKISDFGLAKLLLPNQTRTKTMIRGTRGYVAPEWFKNVPITTKVDVYSFGVMLLEIVCCRKSVVMEFEEDERAILTDWAYDCFLGRRFDLLVENDESAMSDPARLEKWVMIAIWCIQEDPSKRPTMKMVMEMLEGFVDVHLPPTPSHSLLDHSFVD